MDRTNTTLRNKLAEAYFHLVQVRARTFAGRLPNTITAEELVGPGCEGLLDALRGFDLARGITFTAYSSMRIHGAMLDYLREQDTCPRLVRRAGKQYQAWLEEQRRQGASTAPEAMPAELRTLVERHPARAQFSHGAVAYVDEGKTVYWSDLLPGTYDAHHRDEFWEHLLRGTSGIEQTIVTFYFRCDWTMKEIGEFVGLSESRVSQLMSRLLARFRERDDAASVAGWLPATPKV